MKNPLDSILTLPDPTPMNASMPSPTKTDTPVPCACCGLPVQGDQGFQVDVPALTFCDSFCAQEWERRKGKKLFRLVLMAACI